jgi:hypothetical protein
MNEFFGPIAVAIYYCHRRRLLNEKISMSLLNSTVKMAENHPSDQSTPNLTQKPPEMPPMPQHGYAMPFQYPMMGMPVPGWLQPPGFVGQQFGFPGFNMAPMAMAGTPQQAPIGRICPEPGCGAVMGRWIAQKSGRAYYKVRHILNPKVIVVF